jgi:hypothetical protein
MWQARTATEILLVERSAPAQTMDLTYVPPPARVDGAEMDDFSSVRGQPIEYKEPLRN